MARDHVEVEVKYSVPEDAALPSFADLAGVATVDPLMIQELVADYFDTADLRLARLGITLRRRSGGEDSGWHLKVPVTGARHEAHEPLTVDREPPGPLLDALDGVTRGGALSPQVTVRTSREVHRFRDAGGAVLAEVADDRVHAERWASGDPAPSWREWEIELVHGDGALLERAARKLETAGAQPAAHASKLARALEACGVAVVGVPGEDEGIHQHARELVWARLRYLVARLLRWDVLVRRDAEDSVHQMRVTVRRLRSLLATFRPMFERDRTEPLRAELKWLGLLLGDARDAEVLRDRLGELAGGEDPQLRTEAIVSAHHALVRRYRDNHERLVRELGSPRYAALVDSLEHLVADPPFAPGEVDRKAGALRTRVRHDWKRLATAVAEAEEVPDVEARQRKLHDVRKAAKRTRYAAEPLIPIYGHDAERFVMAIEEIQDSLGDLNDAIVARHELQQLDMDESAHGHNTSPLGLLHAREQEKADESEVRFTRAWRDARRTKVLRWLG